MLTAKKHSIFPAVPTVIAAALIFTGLECLQLAIVEHQHSGGRSCGKLTPGQRHGHRCAHAVQAKASPMANQIGLYEMKYFDRTFSGDDVSRLDRLDTFIFGAVTPLTPPARMAHIVASVGIITPPAKTLATTAPVTKAPVTAVASKSGAQGNAQQPADQSPGHYPRVTALEGAILGLTYETQPIGERLARMEMKAFGARSQSDDLSERTDQLDQYAQVRLHVKPLAALAVNPAMSGQPGAASAPRLDNSNPFVRGLRSLAGEMQPNSIAQSANLPVADYAEEDPAEIAHKKMIEQQLADANRPTVPSSHERTLSRVAWCEKQLFGQSYPDMHLLPRLHKLNAELFPQDKEKDIQLMDRIDIIVREVVLRKHPEATT